jgi:nicotinamidase-related amidase
MQPALLVIDVQRGFDDSDHWGPRNNPACEDNVAALIAHARERGWTIVFVRHDSDDPSSPLFREHSGNSFQDVVSGEPDLLVTKRVNSAFIGDPDLHAWLGERGIEALVMCGITTNHCCETTARMGGNLGYDVRFVIDATYTFDRGGLTADELARATAANLEGEFATVVTTADVTRQSAFS